MDLIIGTNGPFFYRALKEVCGGPSDPVGRLTPLGWTAIGPLRPLAMGVPSMFAAVGTAQDVAAPAADNAGLSTLCELPNAEDRDALVMLLNGCKLKPDGGTTSALGPITKGPSTGGSARGVV